MSKLPKAKRKRLVAVHREVNDHLEHRRVIITNDEEGNWYIRRVLVLSHDLDKDQKVYRCDKHLGGPFPSASKAVSFLNKRKKGKK